MRYCPAPSVTAVRILSISSGLVASTLTPGSTAPDESFTDPAMTACASAMVGISAAHASNTRVRLPARIFPPHSRRMWTFCRLLPLWRSEAGPRRPRYTSPFPQSQGPVEDWVQDVRQQGLDRGPAAGVHRHAAVVGGHRRRPTAPIFPIGPYFGVRTAQASSTIAAIRQIVQQQEPGAALDNVATWNRSCRTR